MGKKAPSAPPTPDPVAIAQAQGAANVDTARVQAAMNRVNQYGPDGSIEFSPVGQDQYKMVTTLSPEQQRIYDQTRNAQGLYADIGNRQLGAVSDQLSQPYQNQYGSIANQAIQNAAGVAGRPFQDPYAAVTGHAVRSALNTAVQPVNTDYNSVRQGAIDAANSRLNPQFAQDEEAMRSRLLAQGIGAGSQAWDNEYRGFNNARNDARMQTILNAEGLAGQAIQQTGALRQIPINEAQQLQGMATGGAQQMLAARNQGLNESGQLLNFAGSGMQQDIAARSQPLNETAALLTGQQIGMPALQQVPQTQVAPTDVIGSYGLAQNAAQANYAQQMGAYNANLQGMYGLGGTALMGGGLLFGRR